MSEIGPVSRLAEPDGMHSRSSFDHEGIVIIGVDCATKPKYTGIARGEITKNRLTIQNVECGSDASTPADIILEWLHAANGQPTLLAIDAPLGWPIGMRTALRTHRAGSPIEVEPDKMFKRITDQCVKSSTRKNPMEIGADKIARTAHSALSLLDELRHHTEERIPLMWCPELWKGTRAIEVYPALTLRAMGCEVAGYKKRKGARCSLAENLRSHIAFDFEQKSQMIADDNLIDAVVCVQAGYDFLLGRCKQPPEDEIDTIYKEGWIWFR